MDLEQLKSLIRKCESLEDLNDLKRLIELNDDELKSKQRNKNQKFYLVKYSNPAFIDEILEVVRIDGHIRSIILGGFELVRRADLQLMFSGSYNGTLATVILNNILTSGSIKYGADGSTLTLEAISPKET